MQRPSLLELAVRVLRQAVARATTAPINTDDVRLALRCLLPHVDDRALLVEFWTYAAQLHHANRADSCAAVLAAIVTDLRATDRYPDEDLERRRLMVEAIRAGQAERELKRQVHRRHYFTPPRRRP